MFGFDDSYWLYMNEAEGTGEVDTKLGHINALINDMIQHPRSYVEENFDEMCAEHKLGYLTNAEEDMIWERYSNECFLR